MEIDVTSGINLLVAIAGAVATIFGVVTFADKLLGRRIERHQTVILTAQKTLELKLDEIISEIGVHDARFQANEARLNEADNTISYIKGQSDTMLKIVDLMASKLVDKP